MLENCCFPEMSKTIFESTENPRTAYLLFWLMGRIGNRTEQLGLKEIAAAVDCTRAHASNLIYDLIDKGFLIKETVNQPSTDRKLDRNMHKQKMVLSIQYSKLFEKQYRNMNRQLTVNSPLTDACNIAPVVSLPAPVKKPVDKPSEKPKKGEAKSSKVIEAYSEAYAQVYGGVRPVRNAKLNSLACRLVDAVGEETAVQIVKFYLTHRGSWYVQKKHELDYCLKDVQGLRTEMLAGFKVTNSMAVKADKDSAQDQALAQYLAMKRQQSDQKTVGVEW